MVDIAAPGGDFDFYLQPDYYWDYILSTNNAGYAWMAGTSMASPHVAGVAALIIGKNGGQMAPNLVTKQLLKTADKIEGNGISVYYGNGRVNAFRAVTELSIAITAIIYRLINTILIFNRIGYPRTAEIIISILFIRLVYLKNTIILHNC